MNKKDNKQEQPIRYVGYPIFPTDAVKCVIDRLIKFVNNKYMTPIIIDNVSLVEDNNPSTMDSDNEIVFLRKGMHDSDTHKQVNVLVIVVPKLIDACICSPRDFMDVLIGDIACEILGENAELTAYRKTVPEEESQKCVDAIYEKVMEFYNEVIRNREKVVSTDPELYGSIIAIVNSVKYVFQQRNAAAYKNQLAVADTASSIISNNKEDMKNEVKRVASPPKEDIHFVIGQTTKEQKGVKNGKH